jgi:hypothetical protein
MYFVMEIDHMYHVLDSDGKSQYSAYYAADAQDMCDHMNKKKADQTGQPKSN